MDERTDLGTPAENMPPPNRDRLARLRGASRAAGRVGRTMRETVQQLGPGEEPALWNPRPATSVHSDTDVPREAAELTRVVLEEGAITRNDLGAAVQASHWGPAQFHRALRYALAHGMIRRVGRGVYAAPRRRDRERDGAAEGMPLEADGHDQWRH